MRLPTPTRRAPQPRLCAPGPSGTLGTRMKRTSIVFPIRFATGNVAVQTTTRELSDRGVLVRCLTAPPAGTALEMKLYLPGARDPLHLAGVGREHGGQGQEPGLWAGVCA